MEQAATRTAEEEKEEETVEKERGRARSGKVLFLLSFCVLLLSVSIFCNFCLHTLIRVGLLDYTPPPPPSPTAAASPLTAHWTYTGTHRAEPERESERARGRESETATRRIIVLSKGTCFPHRGNNITLLFTLPTERERERSTTTKKVSEREGKKYMCNYCNCGS